MNTKLQIEKELNQIPDSNLRWRESSIRRIQQEYGYDRDNAERVYDYNAVKGQEAVFSTAFASYFAYKFGPMQTEAAKSYPLFRKLWMRLPIQGSVFAGMFYIGTQMNCRVFPKMSWKNYKNSEGGVHENNFLHNMDYISKFRFFENGEAQCDASSEINNYLNVYTNQPLTKADLLDRIADGQQVDPNFASKFRIKRMGKDKDDLFWTYGKVHGLENLAYATEEEFRACGGDPKKIQNLVDRINDQEKPLGPQNFEKSVEALHEALEQYRASVDNTKGKQYNPSDRKKLLSLPFLLARRAEKASPKQGQKEWGIFEQLYGNSWDKFEKLEFDPEEKITEFNYENFINKHILKTMDTQSEEFKNLIRALNFSIKTEYEQHCVNQAAFQELMPVLRQLDEEESEIFLHLLRNKRRAAGDAQRRSNNLIDESCSDELKKQLAKISEEENFALKNRFKHEKDTMKYADKKRMPIEKNKVKDLLRNQHIFKERINQEVGTYREWEENTQFEKGILTYANEASWGDMREMLNDLGINRQTIRFANVSDAIKRNDSKIHESDANFKNFLNSRLTLIDMTDYEYNFPGANEVGHIPINRIAHMAPLMPENNPQTNTFREVNRLETLPLSTTSRTHRELQEARMAEEEEEEEEEDEDEDDDDEDEDGEGEEGEEGEGEEEEEEEEDEEEGEEDPMAVPDDIIKGLDQSDRYFLHNDKLREKFNEVEIDSFMKLLNVNPHVQWEDDSVHHFKVGTHTYEDESQNLDPYFHLIAEVERKHMERQQAMDFRRGSEIKIMGDDPRKRPVFSRQ